MTRPKRFTDHAGDVLEVRSSGDGDAVLDVDPDQSATAVFVPAHRLAAVVAAMYEAAGQPVPVLPVIHDQAEVNRLAVLIHEARDCNCGAPPAGVDLLQARYLLAHGVRLPEATP